MTDTMQLAAIDYAIIAFFSVGILGLGLYFRNRQNTSDDYLLAGRSVPWVAVGVSQLATLLSAISYLGNPGEAYTHDFQFLFYILVGYLSVPIVIRCYLDFFYRLELTSIHEYLELRFDLRVRLLASGLFILARLAWMATVTIAVSIAVKQLIGVPTSVCIVGTSVVAAAYTLIGGMRAIIWTDVLQFGLFVAGMMGAIWVLVSRDSFGALYEIAVADEKLTMMRWSWDPTVRLSVPIAMAAGVIAGMANLTDQVSMQRYLSTRSLREARRAVWLKPVLSVPVLTLTFVLGLALYGHYQIHPMNTVDAIAGDQVFPYFIRTEMSGGLAGLMITAIFAAAMSSIDSGIHTISTVCVEDYAVRLFRRDLTESSRLRLARFLTVVWAIVIASIALLLVDHGSIISISYKVIAPYFGCLTAVFLLGTVFKRVNGTGAFWGGLLGYACVLMVQHGVYRTSIGWGIHVPWIGAAPADAVRVSNFLLPFVSFSATILAGVLISRCGPRPPADQLKGLCLASHAE